MKAKTSNICVSPRIADGMTEGFIENNLHSKGYTNEQIKEKIIRYKNLFSDFFGENDLINIISNGPSESLVAKVYDEEKNRYNVVKIYNRSVEFEKIVSYLRFLNHVKPIVDDFNSEMKLTPDFNILLDGENYNMKIKINSEAKIKNRNGVNAIMAPFVDGYNLYDYNQNQGKEVQKMSSFVGLFYLYIKSFLKNPKLKGCISHKNVNTKVKIKDNEIDLILTDLVTTVKNF